MQRSACESREVPRVDAELNIAIPYSLEINYGRGDVAVTYPLLERAETRTRNHVGMSPNFIKMLLFRSLSKPKPNCLGDG